MPGLAIWLVAFEVHTLATGSEPTGGLFGRVAYEAVIEIGGLLMLARALTRRAERAAWALLAAGVMLWGAGDIYWQAKLVDLPAIPVPSPADAGYLLLIPCAFAGIVLLVRARVRIRSRTMWLDGLTAGLAVAAVASTVGVHAALEAAGGKSLATAVNLAYPVGDLVLLGLIVAGVALNSWRLEPLWILLAGGIVAFCVADTAYLVTIAAGTYDSVGIYFDVGWAVLPVCGAAAAWAAAGRRQRAGENVRRGVLLPLGFAALAIVVLVVADLAGMEPAAVVLAGGALLAVLARLWVTLAENAAMLRHSRREALTDSLTGLRNRRALTADLSAALAGGTDGALVLALFDLDGFKHYNDTFGHPAGDSLLTRLGDRLRAALGTRGRAYRMGGDEFCALMPVAGEHAAAELVEAAACALSDSGEGFVIGCTYGAIVLPDEAHDPSGALRLADQRMYAQKQGRASAGRQSKDVLLRVLLERDPDLGDHLDGVAELAEAVGRRLGIRGQQLEEIRHAAELHDVGKVAIPDAILHKAGPLDDGEWEFVRRHTLIGARIVSAAPALHGVAALVRASHERWDGSGYPDGRAGAKIPLGARVIAVCDAFDAMIADRPYSSSISVQGALAELRRGAGTQFDPVVVEAFAAELAARAASPARDAQAASANPV